MEVKLEKMENEDVVDSEILSIKKEAEDCSRCLGLLDKVKEVEGKCIALELDNEKQRKCIGMLEDRIRVVTLEKLVAEEDVRSLRKRNEEIKQRKRVDVNVEKGMGQVVDLTHENNEEDRVFQLMFENTALEVEKKKAESEIEAWRTKCEELELRIKEMEKSFLTGFMVTSSSLPKMGLKGIGGAGGLASGIDHSAVSAPRRTGNVKKVNEDQHASGTPPISMEIKLPKSAKDGKIMHKSEYNSGRIRKQLVFAEEGSPSKKMAPSTPAAGRPHFNAIIISDSEDEPCNLGLNLSSPGTVAMDRVKLLPNGTKMGDVENQSDEGGTSGCKIGSISSRLTPKGRRSSKIITSDSESDFDDSIPISHLKSKYVKEPNPCSHTENAAASGDKLMEPATRRRLVKKNSEEKCALGSRNLKIGESEYISEIPNQGTMEDDDSDTDDSEREGESLDGFIVHTSDDSAENSDYSCNEGVNSCWKSPDADSSTPLENPSDGNLEYGEIMSALRRDRYHKTKWDFEADMLSDFGKNPKLCMKAVCALYRQQTSEEQSFKETIVVNGRGFNQCDAFRGSSLAEFLLDGDKQGDVKKSVEDLLRYDPKGLEVCRTLAYRYSKQLFEIYKNGEDPFFGPI